MYSGHKHEKAEHEQENGKNTRSLLVSPMKLPHDKNCKDDEGDNTPRLVAQTHVRYSVLFPEAQQRPEVISIDAVVGIHTIARVAVNKESNRVAPMER